MGQQALGVQLCSRLACVAFALVTCVICLAGPVGAEEAPGTVRGMVVDAEGNGVGGARIRALRAHRPMDPFAEAVEIVTDAKGRFSAELVPGHYLAVATKGLLTSDNDQWRAGYWELKAGQTLDEIRIPLAEGGRVTGVVVSKEDGVPLANAGVIMDQGMVTRTDAKGRFEFKAVGFREHRLKAVYPGLAFRHVDINTLGQAEAEVRIELPPGHALRGTVTDEQGQAVSGAMVGAFYNGSIFHSWMQGCYTDEQGKYELTGYAVGSRPHVRAEHEGFAPSPNDWSPEAMAGDTVLDIVLGQGYEVKGRVVGPDGKPVAGVNVSHGFNGANPHYKSTKTDGEGRFRLDRLPEDREEYIVAHGEGYAPAYQKARPGKGEAAPDLAFTIVPGAVARGKVVDRDGKPLAGARLYAQISIAGRCGSEYIGEPIEVDKEGRFELDSLPHSGATVDAMGPDQTYSPVRERPLRLDGENVIVMDPAGCIVGRVTDGDTGEPITVFNVKLGQASGEGSPDEPSASYSCHLSVGGQDCRSEEGAFTIEELIGRAPHAVIVNAEGYAPTRIDRVVARPKDAKEWPIEIKLGRGLALSGSVTAAETGEPLADAEVVLLIPSDPRPEYWCFSVDMLERPAPYGMSVRRARTDEAGHFEFKNVAIGQHLHLAARHEHYAIVIMTDIDPKTPVSLKLARGGVIEGSVKGYPGAELKDAGVSLQSRGDGMDFGRKRAGKDGSFGFTNLPAGDYSVSLTHEWRNRRSVHATLAEGESLRINFGNLPGAKVFGRLTREGEPIGRANVQLHFGQSFGQLGHEITDEQGRYEIAGVPAGSYVVIANDGKEDGFGLGAGCSRARRLITVGDADQEVDLSFHSGRIKGRVVDAVTGQAMAGEVELAAYPMGEPIAPDHLIACSVGDADGLHFRAIWGFWRDPRGQGLLATRRLGDPSTRMYLLRANCGQDSSFEFVGIGPGTYLITAQGPENSAPAPVTTVTVGADGESDPVEVRLDADAGLRLKVQDAVTGAPVAKARVFLCTPSGTFLASELRVRASPKEQVVCTTGGCGAGSQYKYPPMVSDDEGAVAIDGLCRGEYGVWVLARGYSPRWLAPLAARQRGAAKAPVTVAMQPAGTLVLKAAPDLLEGVENPYVAYRIRSAAGGAVFPGGEGQDRGPLETGVGPLGGDKAEVYRVDVLPPGDYTLAWELRRGPEAGESSEVDARDLICSGEASFAISAGEESVVVLSE